MKRKPLHYFFILQYNGISYGVTIMKDTILFDLDGTLLPMDFHKFMKYYFQSIGNYFKDKIDPLELMEKINQATEHTVLTNDGRTNEEIFVEYFNSLTTKDQDINMEEFYKYYKTDFALCKNATWVNDNMVEAIKVLKDKGYNLVVATNPLLPLISNYYRIDWAGLNKDDFSYVSSFEENRFCKPHPDFYKEVLEKINKTPEKVIMVGNDKREDLVSSVLGIETYLIEDCLLKEDFNDFTPTNQGSYEHFLQFAKNLAAVK